MVWSHKLKVNKTIQWNDDFDEIFLSLAALEVVKMTTSSAANDENFIKMTFSCMHIVAKYP